VINRSRVQKITRLIKSSPDHEVNRYGRQSYLPQLDAIRAIAVLFVMIFHFIPESDAFAPLGGIGVRLFFVLSGFLITRILLEARDRPIGATLKTFYVRRFLRIFPLFYFALFVSYVLDFGVVRSTIGWHLAYLTNFLIYSRGQWPGAVSHFWSLAVEEQFYLIWPLLALSIPIRSLPWLIAAMVPIAPLTLLLTGDPMAGVLPISCVDALGMGALLAIPASRRYAAAAGLWIGVPLLIGTIAIRWFLAGYRLDVALGFGVALASAWAVSGAADGFGGRVGAFLEWRPLIYLGTISYGVYVYHALMPYALARLFPVWTYPTGQRFVILAASTIAIASLSYRLLEAPILAYKKRYIT
jgi:peptidoglycan/LPS O-acetylase OafA/YrhL